MVSVSLPENRIRLAGWAGFAVLMFVLAVFPLAVINSGYVRLAMFAVIFGGYATSWNLFSGYSGYISFGHSVFFGLGGFFSTVLFADFGIPPWVGMLVGAVLAVLVALIIGYITFSAGLTGIYFGLSMLAVPLIFAPVLVYLGYIEVSVPIKFEQPILYMSFSNLTGYYYIAFGLLVITMLLTWWMQRNRMGYYLKAIHSSEEAASSLGVKTMRYKLLALSLSAFLSALFGAIYVQSNFIYATHSVFSLALSAQPVIFAVAGGLGTLFGPLLGAVVLYPIAEILRTTYGSAIPGIHNIIYGVVLIFIIIFLPDGFYTSIRNRLLTDPGVSDTDADLENQANIDSAAEPTTDAKEQDD